MNLLRKENALDSVTDLPFAPATEQELQQLHRHDYVSQVMTISGFGGGTLGPDTYLNDATFDAAALAAGAGIAATQAVLRGDVQRAFALVRPPGHHAFADHGEGFCLFNNMAFAARAALTPDAFQAGTGKALERALERVMIVDFDVHHGNGTQALFYDDPRALFISSHQMPLYPGSGYITEIGEGAGQGATINVPLFPGAGDMAFSRVLNEIVVPAARRYKPQLLLVSAGFDAHWRDPLAQLNVSLDGFAKTMRGLCELSDEFCGGRMVVIMEGGYDLSALSHGVLNTLRQLQGGAAQDVLGPPTSRETDISKILDAVKEVHQLSD
jgi:acetoin utilization deacetylase AcuC-like enzyme